MGSKRKAMIRLAILCLFLGLACSKPPPGPPPRRRSRSGIKWVWCKDEWKKVNKDDCKYVFADPELKVCNNPANEKYFAAFPNADVYLWMGNGNYAHCKHLDTCICPACQTEKIEGGIVVAGGVHGRSTHYDYHLNSTELLVNNNHHCYLSELPKNKLYHTLNSNDNSLDINSLLLCGGEGSNSNGYSSNSKECFKFNDGSWSTAPPLKNSRNRHSGISTDDGALLIGGSSNSMGIAGKGEKFALKHVFHSGCVIEDTSQYIILTGGYDANTKGLALVTKYHTKNGFIGNMPSLINPRFSHACGMFINEGKKTYTVAGGYHLGRHDTTETLTQGEASWKSSVPLPVRMSNMRSLSYESYMLVIGGTLGKSDESSNRREVLKFDGKKWTEAGKLAVGRWLSAVAKVNWKQAAKYCK